MNTNTMMERFAIWLNNFKRDSPLLSEAFEAGRNDIIDTLVKDLKQIKKKKTTGFTYLGEVTMNQNEGFNEAVKLIQQALKRHNL